MHWTGWERLCLVSIPCESRTDLGLEVTVNVMPNCGIELCLLEQILMADGNVRIEPDIRHAELVLRNLVLEGSKAKPLTTPGFKMDVKELALREKRFRWFLKMLRGTGVVL